MEIKKITTPSQKQHVAKVEQIINTHRGINWVHQVCKSHYHVTNIDSISHRVGIMLNVIHGRRHQASRYFHGREETQNNKRNLFK